MKINTDLEILTNLAQQTQELQDRLDSMTNAAIAYRTMVNHLQDSGQLSADAVKEAEAKEVVYGENIDREFELQTLRYDEDED